MAVEQALHMAVVHLANIAVSLMGRAIFEGVNIQAHKGDQVLLTGANGAGKTTLLRLLATAVRPRRGVYTLFDGQSRAQHLQARPRLGLMTHQHHFYEPLTGRENLRLIGALCGHTDACVQRRVLQEVGLDKACDRPVTGYSAGMKRRLALARMLLLVPELVLLDEPFGQLDGEGVALMHATLRALKKRGATVVLATHDVERGRAHCNRLWHITGGRIDESTMPGGEGGGPV